MKAMFVGGRLHAQLLEVPKGSSEYLVEVKIGERFIGLTYQATQHPQVFVLAHYGKVEVRSIPIDFYTHPRIVKWIKALSRQSNTVIFGMTSNPER